MVKHGALSRSHVYRMLASKDARVRRAAFTLLEASNPALRRNSELYIEIIRFIWHANPSYDVYREFSRRHLLVPYKVHELIAARLQIEKRKQQIARLDRPTEDTRRHQGGFFKRLLRAVRLRLDHSERSPAARSAARMSGASYALGQRPSPRVEARPR
jgi:hypothetical protein